MSLKTLKFHKKSFFVIPYLFTFANALFGFLSVVNALNDNWAVSAYCIILAAVMDCFDGRLARALGSTSCLGMELDSLCDAISFCFAPVILLYSWYGNLLGVRGLFVLGIYLCSGLFRLAKFNTTCDDQKSFFCGLPTTLAAFIIATLVIYSPWFEAHHAACLVSPKNVLSLVAGLAFLMVSSLRFPSFKYGKKKSLLSWLIVALGSLIVVANMLYGYPLFFFILLIYVLGSLLYNGYLLFYDRLSGIIHSRRF